jgi:RNA polymerase sigma factor (TIGR02999 family)
MMTDLYGELRRIAAQRLRAERSGHTLQPTALVHEIYLKLSNQTRNRFVDGKHFLAIVSRVMRQVLVDYARARATGKRNGDGLVPFTTSMEVPGDMGAAPVELLELDQALNALATQDEALAQLIEMRYFGGMTAEETAEVLNRSVHVVRHDLRLAQAWLRRELSRN